MWRLTRSSSLYLVFFFLLPLPRLLVLPGILPLLAIAGPDGFPKNWTVNGHAVFSRSTGQHSPNASASLMYNNSDEGLYVLCRQRLPTAQPGRSYQFGGLVRALSVSAVDPAGATICMQWLRSDGSFGGGSYPSGVHGTTPWTAVGGRATIPPDAQPGSASITVYLRQGCTGTAWFDGIFVRELPPHVLQTIVLQPNYRGRIRAEYPRAIVIRAHIALPAGGASSQLAWDLEATLTSANGTLVERVVAQASETVDLTFNTVPQSLLPGGYNVSVSCLNGSTVVGETHHTLRRISDGAPVPTAYIDGQQRLIRQGKPLFPIGLYTGGIHEEDLRLISGTAFNAIMPYGESNRTGMDLASRYNVSVAFSLKDAYLHSRFCPPSITNPAEEEAYVRQRLKEFRGHPALLSWYLNDE